MTKKVVGEVVPSPVHVFNRLSQEYGKVGLFVRQEEFFAPSEPVPPDREKESAVAMAVADGAGNTEATASHSDTVFYLLARADAIAELIGPDAYGRLRDDVLWIIDALDDLTDPEAEPRLSWGPDGPEGLSVWNPHTEAANRRAYALAHCEDREDDDCDREPDPPDWWHGSWDQIRTVTWAGIPRWAGEFYRAFEQYVFASPEPLKQRLRHGLIVGGRA